jgi:hypothetical protein
MLRKGMYYLKVECASAQRQLSRKRKQLKRNKERIHRTAKREGGLELKSSKLLAPKELKVRGDRGQGQDHGRRKLEATFDIRLLSYLFALGN